MPFQPKSQKAISHQRTLRSFFSRLSAFSFVLLALWWLSASSGVYAGVNQWTSNGPEGKTVPGFVALAIDPTTPTTIYAGGDYGICKSTDGGASWTEKYTGISGEVNTIAIDPKTTDTVYVGTNNGLFKSMDGGDTFSVINVRFDLPDSFYSPYDPFYDSRWLHFYALAIDAITPTTIYASISSSLDEIAIFLLNVSDIRVFKSTDAGISWTPLNTGIPSGFTNTLNIDPNSPETIYAGTWEGIFKSTDGGENWTAINNGLPSIPLVRALAIDPLCSNTVYAGIDIATHPNPFSTRITPGGVFKSTDGGKNWTSSGLGKDRWVASLSIDPATPTIVYAGTGLSLGPPGSKGVLKSSDGGTTWTVSGLTDTTVNTLAIDPSAPANVYAGTGFGVFKSTDRGANWADANTGLTQTLIEALAIDSTGEVIIAGTRTTGDYFSEEKPPGSIFKSADGGISWTDIGSDLQINDVYALAIDPINAGIFYAATDVGLFKSIDGGISWFALEGLQDEWRHVSALAIDPVTPTTIFAGFGLLFKSTDGGTNWTAVNNGLPNAYIRTILINPSDSDIVYVGTSSGVFKSVDGGESWTEVNGGVIEREVQTLAMDPSRPDTIYAGADRGIFKSIDGGSNWIEVSKGFPIYNSNIRAVVTDPVTPGMVYAAYYGGVVKSSNGGHSWSAMNEGLPAKTVTVLAIHPISGSVLHAGTSGEGVFSFHMDPKPSPPIQQLTVTLNQSVFWPSDELRVGLGVWNSGPAFFADFYFGFFLPDGATLVFLINLNPLTGVSTALDDDPWTFSPLAANLEIPANMDVIIPDVLALPLTTNDIPKREYFIFGLLSTPGAFQDGKIDENDILDWTMKSFIF